jgi:2',3'-cyclic-nucleotide 2'-phosphodiesterase/3'-nucleotidase
MSDRVTLLFTADLHGRIGPEDPLTGSAFPGGAARAATLVAEARRRDPEAIYLDLGDVVQGTPLSWLWARERPQEPHPMVRVLNRMGCRAMVVGNHEFNFGLPFLESLRQAAGFPVLGANVVGPSGEPYFDPVLCLERHGRRIAVLGVTSPQVPRWEEPWNYEGLRFRDAVETVKEWVPRLRAKADAVVVAAHMGWTGHTDGGLEVPYPAENAGRLLADEVEGIDVLLMAHTHRFEQRRGRTGTLAVQPGWGGQAVGEVTFTWNGSGRPEVRYEERRAEPYVVADPGVLSEVEEAEARAEARVDEVLGTASGPFRLRNVRFADNAILTLFHRVQLDAAGTDLSSTALFRAHEELAAGPIRRRDVFRIYPYENDLTVLELTVDGVREYLEETALTYAGPSVNGEGPPLDPRVSLYNHDVVAGAEYVVDPGRPPGSRIVALTFRGEELPGSEKLTLAVTSYRAQGGGGYRSLRGARVVERTGRETRRLVEDWIRERGTVEPEVFDNWRVIGAPGSAELDTSP